MDRDPHERSLPLTATDFHTLLVLGEAPLYGYGIMKAVARESNGAVAPEIGSLYRTLGKLTSRGWVEEAPSPTAADAHPGKERRYFRLTPAGVDVLRQEAARLRDAVSLARRRDLLPDSGGS